MQSRSPQPRTGGVDLGDYVQVKDRIARFYELFGQGRIVTTEVRLTREPDDTPRVLVEAKAYRNPEDSLPGVGWSWMELPGKTSFTRGSELENTETSAWGRAIAALGVLVDHSIASQQEINNKGSDEPQRPSQPRQDAPQRPEPTPLRPSATLVPEPADDDVDELHGPTDPTVCGWRLGRGKGVPALDCDGRAGHPGQHSWAELAIKEGGRVIPPVTS